MYGWSPHHIHIMLLMIIYRISCTVNNVTYCCLCIVLQQYYHSLLSDSIIFTWHKTMRSKMVNIYKSIFVVVCLLSFSGTFCMLPDCQEDSECDNNNIIILLHAHSVHNILPARYITIIIISTRVYSF